MCEFSIGFGPGVAIKSNNWWRVSHQLQPNCSPHVELLAERGLVELDLLVAADLVGELLPGRRDGVGARLRRRPLPAKIFASSSSATL